MVDYEKLVDIGLSPDTDTLTRRLIPVAESIGFGLASGSLVCGRFGSPNAEVLPFGNPPEAFKAASRSMANGMRDPVMTRLLARPGHVIYGQDLYVASGAADLWNCQAFFGYRQGLSTSIHASTHAEVLFFGVDGPDTLPKEAELIRLKAAVQLIALHVREAMLRIAHPVSTEEAFELEAPEVEALQQITGAVYAKRGHLTSISTISSPRLRVSMTKLKAQSIPEAVIRAVGKGLIEP